LLERLPLVFALLISRFATSPTLHHYDGNLLDFVACRQSCAPIGLRFLRLRRVKAPGANGSGRAAPIWTLDAVSQRSDALVRKPLQSLFAPWSW